MLSFVIPAHDEAAVIGACVRSVRDFAPRDVETEVIVVDNSSGDDTAAIAEDAGAVVITSTARTIGAVRNEGVDVSQGGVLVFLDADCVLTPEWSEGIEAVLEQLEEEPSCFAGSQVRPPRGERHLLWDYWFEPFVAQETASHIGSAHLICPRRTFLSLGGFDEALETGEDYDLCARLQATGGSLLNVPSLRVEHYGFPKRWSEFVRRERWHGRPDLKSLTSFRSSRVAIVSVTFVGLCAFAVVAGLLRQPTLAMGALGAAVLLVGIVSRMKLGHAGLKAQAFGLLILPVYFYARATAGIDLFGRGRVSRGAGAQPPSGSALL
jgi:glycosyltransferase involved in cell wall biosynthesis